MFVHMMLETAGLRVLVVGGGAVAARKTAVLLAGGAEITLLAPGRQEAYWQEIAGQCRWLPRLYDETFDLAGFQLVIAATDRPEVNRALAERCRDLGILCNCASAPEAGSVVLPGLVQGRDFSLAVSSGGQLPFLTKKLKDDLKQFLAVYEEKYDRRFVEFLGGLRRQIIEQFAGRPDLAAQKQAMLKRLAELAEHKVDFIGGKHDGEHEYDTQAALDWLQREQAGAGPDAAGGGANRGGQSGLADGD